MFKKEIGISIYPEKAPLEKTKDYLLKASKLGYKTLFVSFIHMLNSSKEDIQKVIDAIKYAEKLNFYIIADFEYESLKMLNIDIKDPFKAKEMGINCIRFDSPALAQELADLTHNEYGIDIQLNMSNNDMLIYNVLDYQPILNRLSGCHNFYPQKYTALPLEYFHHANEKFNNNNLSTGAFIGSKVGNLGPTAVNKELITVEMFRELDVVTQAKFLFYSNEIDNVMFGNAFATDEELESISKINRDEITLRLDFENKNKLSNSEKEILKWKKHFRRGDITKYFIRSTQSRVEFKSNDIKPNNFKKIYNRGDVVIINNNGKNYKGELHIILRDEFQPESNMYNFVGKINKDEDILLNFIKPWSKFRFEY